MRNQMIIPEFRNTFDSSIKNIRITLFFDGSQPYLYFVDTENEISFHCVYLVQLVRLIDDLDNVPIWSEILV